MNIDSPYPTLALMGRPNVGKSTLFNRLVGKRLAIVHDQPGVTRDWRVMEGGIGDLKFNVIDTAGLDPTGHELKADETLAKLMTDHAMEAIEFADILLMVVDGRAGLHPLDQEIATKLRKTDKTVLLVVNKCEGAMGEARAAEAYQLGLGDPIAISAEHGEGMGALYQSLMPFIDEKMKGVAAKTQDAGMEKLSLMEEAELLEAEKKLLLTPLKLAIVGRPNVGKSTLVNKLSGAKRVLTGPMAGLTRDAIYVNVDYDDMQMRLVDTAGLRRKARIVDGLEKSSNASTRQAIELSEVVMLMLSSEDGMEKQDLTIAGTILDEGRALVIAINKMDLVWDRRDEILQSVQDRLLKSLPQARDVPVMMICAEKEKGIKPLIEACHTQRRIWHTRLTTGKLNDWLRQLLLHHPPPAIAGRRPKPRYMSQIKIRPPSFALFGTRVDLLPDSYQRYIVNRLRDDFELPGVPLRLILRAADNPYDKKKKRH
ncbi:MAG: ribosome biogenesis GTPase Der [Alphaproteobacteria bacterium]